MTLNPNPLSHVIIFHDGSKKMITEAQSHLIFQASSNQKSISTPQLGLINFSAIAKIISLADYYDQYPENVPEPAKEFTTEEKSFTLEEQLLGNKSRFQSFLTGLKKYIDQSLARKEKPVNAIKVYEKNLAVYKKTFI